MSSSIFFCNSSSYPFFSDNASAYFIVVSHIDDSSFSSVVLEIKTSLDFSWILSISCLIAVISSVYFLIFISRESNLACIFSLSIFLSVYSSRSCATISADSYACQHVGHFLSVSFFHFSTSDDRSVSTCDNNNLLSEYDFCNSLSASCDSVSFVCKSVIAVPASEVYLSSIAFFSA